MGHRERGVGTKRYGKSLVGLYVKLSHGVRSPEERMGKYHLSSRDT